MAWMTNDAADTTREIVLAFLSEVRVADNVAVGSD